MSDPSRTETLTAEEVATSREFAEIHRERFHVAVCDSHEALRADLTALRAALDGLREWLTNRTERYRGFEPDGDLVSVRIDDVLSRLPAHEDAAPKETPRTTLTADDIAHGFQRE